jgi:exodeoxyribonuclease V alpha subunit
VLAIKVRVVKKIYYSAESGFGVFKISAKGESRSIPNTITGTLLNVAEGDFLTIEGKIVNHPRYGQQIQVHSFAFTLPEDKDGIIAYLSAGRIKGVGAKTAAKIVDTFGADTFNVLEKEPHRLEEIKGMRKSVIQEIRQNFQDNKIIRDLSVRLSPYGVGPETILKIYQEYSEDTFEVLKSNPYTLINRIRGIGFRIADAIARGFGIASNDPYRLAAGIEYFLELVEQREGDLYIEEDSLVKRTASLLDVELDEVLARVERLVESGDLIRENIPHPVLSSRKNCLIEKAIARKMFALQQGKPSPLYDMDQMPPLAEDSLTLTAEQMEAVHSAINHKMTIITGGPGTGKTTLIRAIIHLLLEQDLTVLVSAPTGRAAKRIEEATLYRASTIHRMLKVDPKTGAFIHNESNPLPTDAVVVDEFSMVDCALFHALLRAISSHTRLIIIGDKDQLPSVGPGNVLRDIIGSGFFKVIFLNRNFRQTKDSLIIENAYRINSGEALILSPYTPQLDFVFVKVDGEKEALQKVLNIVNHLLPEMAANSTNFQILVPMYRGESGIDNLNAIIQKTFNLVPDGIGRGTTYFKSGDKVMQLKNNYEKEIFNGEQGIVAEIDQENKSIVVDFWGYPVEYTLEEFDQLTLSYAISVHKSQGSEYDYLVLVLLPGHTVMLNRELFYTAVTRARKKIYLVSDERTLARAIANNARSERKTLLPRRLREIFLEPPANG